MAFNDFTFPQVQHDLGLTVREADLFAKTEALLPRPEFLSQLELGSGVALAINTEKARSEFIIAPVLLELRRLAGDRMGLFSGISLEGDTKRGLYGVCDFLVTASGLQFVVAAPLVAIVEAKNDNLLSGLGQCIATLVTAQIVNEREGIANRVVYGVVTTGSAWKFLRLAGVELSIDRREYYIDNVGKVLAILQGIVLGAGAETSPVA